MAWPHTDFARVFAGGRFGDFDAAMRHVGDLEIVSGCVAVYDPDGSSSVELRGLPSGTFPVEIAIAKCGDHEAIAAMRVAFERERATTWELHRPDHDRPHAPFERGGLVVESGWVAMCDASRRDPFVEIEIGTHDSTYAIYVGRTSEGRVSSLAVDFDVLTVPIFENVELALPLAVGKIDDPQFALVGVEAWATAPNALELRGDIARIAFARVGDPAAKESIAPIVETRPSFVQRFTFPVSSGRAFVKLYVGRRALD